MNYYQIHHEITVISHLLNTYVHFHIKKELIWFRNYLYCDGKIQYNTQTRMN